MSEYCIEIYGNVREKFMNFLGIYFSLDVFEKKSTFPPEKITITKQPKDIGLYFKPNIRPVIDDFEFVDHYHL